MLDAVDAGPDAGPDAGIAVCVGGDPQTVAVGLVDDGASSSSEYCCAPAAELKDITPPDAEILMSWAPYFIW